MEKEKEAQEAAAAQAAEQKPAEGEKSGGGAANAEDKFAGDTKKLIEAYREQAESAKRLWEKFGDEDEKRLYEQTMKRIQELEGQSPESSQVEKQPRDIFIERIRASRPDANYDDDEQELYRQAGSLMDELESRDMTAKKFMDDMSKWFNDEPEEAMAVLDRVHDGVPLIDGLRRYKGEEAFNIKEGDEGWESYQQAQKLRREDNERRVNLANEFKENAKASDELFSKFAKDNELDDETQAAISKMYEADIQDMLRGKLSEGMLQRYLREHNHDADMAAAREQGHADGKNEAIEAKHKRMQGSGLPAAEAGGDLGSEAKGNAREELARKLQAMRMG